MNDINFLPPGYVTRFARRNRLIRQGILCLLIMVCMLGWFMSNRRHLIAMEQAAANAEHQLAAARTQSEELKRLQSQLSQLSQAVKVQDQLTPPLDFTTVISSIAPLMSESMTLTELSMTSEGPEPKAPVAAGTSNSEAAKPKPIAPLRIEIVGLAPEDVEIADFVGRLSEHRLFTQVKMAYSKPREIKNVLAREFRIEMQVPMDRLYRVIDPQEVAHAN